MFKKISLIVVASALFGLPGLAYAGSYHFQILVDANQLWWNEAPLASRFAADGVWAITVNSGASGPYTPSGVDWTTALKTLNAGTWAVSEDDPNGTSQVDFVSSSIGRMVDGAMFYLEDGMAVTTTINDDQIAWYAAHVVPGYGPIGPRVIVLARSYGDSSYQTRLQHAIWNKNVSGAAFEFVPSASPAGSLDAGCAYVLSTGKKCYLLMPPSAQMTDYEARIQDAVAYFTPSGVLNNPRTYIVLATYSRPNAVHYLDQSTNASDYNSIEATVKWLKSLKTTLPIGSLDSVSSDGTVTGWSLDPDTPSAPIKVDFYLDGPYWSGTPLGSATANIPRPDVLQVMGYSGDHGYVFHIPSTVSNGTHSIYAYGIDSYYGNTLLAFAPVSANFTLIHQATCTFSNQSVAAGATVNAYQSSSVAYGSTCVSEPRTCSNGSLSGSYANASCSGAAPASCTFNGSTIANGLSVTAYQSSSVAYGSQCVSETRTCNNGTLSSLYQYTLSGPYQYATCSVTNSPAPASCTFNGQTVAHGASVTAYQSSSVASGSTCVSQSRACTNGTLSGSYQYATCSVTNSPAPTSCTFNSSTFASGLSVAAYQSSSVAYGSQCVSETRTCNKGTLSGSYQYANCTVAAGTVTPNSSTLDVAPSVVSAKSCTTPWGSTVQNGVAIAAYQSANAASQSACNASSEIRTCSDGTLSGSYQYANCTVAAGTVTPNSSTLDVAPSAVSAQSTNVQAQIASLLAQIAQLQQQLGQARSTQPTQTTGTVTGSAVACPNPALTRSLARGSAGTDVAALQGFLINTGYLTGTNVTGYFGALTEAALQRFQAAKGIASSGTPGTTGYGYVGPKTRYAIVQVCSPQR